MENHFEWRDFSKEKPWAALGLKSQEIQLQARGFGMRNHFLWRIISVEKPLRNEHRLERKQYRKHTWTLGGLGPKGAKVKTDCL